MKRLIKNALYHPEEAIIFEDNEIRKHLVWERAAERIMRIDPTGARSYALWYRLFLSDVPRKKRKK